MECGCLCDSDLEPPSALSKSYPKARKPHRCYECGATIPVGIKYQRVWGIWNHEMSVFRTCLPCSRIRDAYCMDYGVLRTQVQEALGVDLARRK